MPGSAPTFGLTLAITFWAAGMVTFGRAQEPAKTNPASTGAGYQYYRSGNPEDVKRQTRPGVMLMGGGSDLDAAFKWMCDRAGGGDFLVLRASGTDDYNPYIRGLCPQLNSVATLIITAREGASQAFVVDKIQHAEAIFISGGDQSNYVKFWTGTPARDALNEAIAKGRPIGGTSAGLAVLGQFVFAALMDTIHSPEALANPYDPHLTLVRNFLRVPQMEGMITDTHFVARDRLGRTLAFLARIVADGWATQASAIAVDEKNAAALEPDGTARVMGNGSAYFLRTSGAPEVCKPKTPLTYRNISVYRITGAGSFNLVTWKGSGGTAYTLSVASGVVTSTQPSGSIY